eukprot:6681833-Ditylum_brightwellii.AAC.1
MGNFQRRSSIPIGDIGFEFVKCFSGGELFNSKVIQILNHCKYLYNFNDGKQRAYTLSQLEHYSMSKLAASESDEYDSDTDTTHSGKDREAPDEEHNDRDADDVAVENMQANKDGGKVWNQHLRYLLKSPLSTTMEE